MESLPERCNAVTDGFLDLKYAKQFSVTRYHRAPCSKAGVGDLISARSSLDTYNIVGGTYKIINLKIVCCIWSDI